MPTSTRSVRISQCLPIGVVLVLGGATPAAPPSTDMEIGRLIRQLSHDDFDQREAATRALREVGKPALPALRQAALESADAEVRVRAKALVQTIQDGLCLFIDLKPHVNHFLNEAFHDSFPGNDLATLPTGVQTFAGIRFSVGSGVVQLASPRHPGGLEKAEGIKVSVAVTKLYFLHSCGRSAGTPVDTPVGKFVVRYDDDSTAEIAIVYGRDVVDWWEQPGVADPTRSKVGWEGTNDGLRGTGRKVKLFLTTWDNPHPNKRIRTLDYLSTGDRERTGAAPFCVAISAER